MHQKLFRGNVIYHDFYKTNFEKYCSKCTLMKKIGKMAENGTFEDAGELLYGDNITDWMKAYI